MSARDDYPHLVTQSRVGRGSGLEAQHALDEIDRLRAEVARLTLNPRQYVVEVRRPAQGEIYLDPKSFRDPPVHEQTITTPYERRVVVVASGGET